MAYQRALSVAGGTMVSARHERVRGRARQRAGKSKRPPDSALKGNLTVGGSPKMATRRYVIIRR